MIKGPGVHFTIKPISPISPGKLFSPQGMSPSDKKETSFQDMLSNSIDGVNRLQQEADLAGRELAIGKVENIHDVMISMEKASVAFRMMVQVRNKMLDAYREIMRMQV